MIRTAHFLGPKGAQNLPKGVKGARFGDCSLALSSCSLRQKIGRTPFTSSSLSCYIGAKLKGPVRKNTTEQAFATPNDKRGFVMPKFLGLVRLRASVQWLWSMVGATRKDVRMACSMFLTTMLHPLRVRTQTVVLRTQQGVGTMTATTQQASRAAASTPTTGTTDPIQLHADARNALSMAIFYLRQPQANVPGARRKAIQALSALRGLDLSLEG